MINNVLPASEKGYIVNILSDNDSLFTAYPSHTNTPVASDQNSLFDYSPYTYLAGSDESGKGDYFGPLVTVAFTCSKEDINKLKQYGVKDSKLLNDEKITIIAKNIINDFKDNYESLILMPELYNKVYKEFSSLKNGLNELLAWSHSQVIGNLYKKHQFEIVTIDKFAKEKVIEFYVKKECQVKMNIVTKAESDIVVATASVIARYFYIKLLKYLSEKYNVALLKGASNKVKEQKRNIDKNILPFICKLHFKM